MSRGQRRLFTTILLLGLLVVGLSLFAVPTISETNAHEFSAQVTQTELDASIGYAPPGYSVDAHITSQNQVTVTLSLIGTSTVIFSKVFPAGTFDITQITIVNGGNLFLTLKPQNGVFTQMSVFARIFQQQVTYQYAWVGVIVLGVAGLLALASFYPQTLLGRAAGRIIPLRKIGLAYVLVQIK